MTDRIVFRDGEFRRSSRSRGSRGGGQTNPRGHLSMEGFFPIPQTAERVSDSNRSFYSSAYNQNYGDNLDSYVDIADNEINDNQNYLERDNLIRDYNSFQENYNNNDSFGLPPHLNTRINNDYIGNMNSGFNVGSFYDPNFNNNYGENRTARNFSDIDMRQNNGLEHEFNFDQNNGIENEINFDQRRFHNLDNFQVENSQPVTHKALRDILSGLIVPSQNEMPNNNLVHDLNRNSVRHPPLDHVFSRNSHEVVGGTGVARSQARIILPDRPSGLSKSEWRAMLQTLSQTRAASGAVPPLHSVNNSCAALPLLNNAEEYLDENDTESNFSGSYQIVPTA